MTGQGRSLVLFGTIVFGSASVACAPVDEPPGVSGPVSGGRLGIPYNAMPPGMAEAFGYAETEFFMHGTAQAFAASGAWSQDGRWSAQPSTRAAYKTRLLVRRPVDANRFNGTVVVEWLNVSAGMDTDPVFGQAHLELLRNGYAYVAVSAQLAGIEQIYSLPVVPGLSTQALKAWDPARYGALTHPGDDYAYDIFSQVGEALRQPSESDALSGLKSDYLLAVGESQSAGRMLTYVNAVHPLARVYDGFIIHSRGGGGAPLSAGTLLQPAISSVRTDLSEPVLQFETETDLFMLGFHRARQPDTTVLRTWEVAGTAHADRTTLDYGVASLKQAYPEAPDVNLAASCGGRVNEGPQRYVMNKAVAAMRDWMAGGTAPRSGLPLRVSDGKIARDAFGNALGGIRTPAVDVPVARLSGEDNASGGFCGIFGSTTPFDAASLAELYPTHDEYVNRVHRSARDALEAGHLLAVDQAAIEQAAESAAVPQ